MSTDEQGEPLDFLLSLFGFVTIFFPLASVGNSVFESPALTVMISVAIGILSFGGAYRVVRGEWSLGKLGEYIFVLHASAVGWAFIIIVITRISGISFSNSNPLPDAVSVAVVYLTAYGIVYRT